MAKLKNRPVRTTEERNALFEQYQYLIGCAIHANYPLMAGILPQSRKRFLRHLTAKHKTGRPGGNVLEILPNRIAGYNAHRVDVIIL